MKRILFSLTIFCFITAGIIAQDSIKYWKTNGLAALNFNQVSLTNWAAGGQSAVAGTALFNFTANYKKGKSAWDNVLDLAYGMNNQKQNDKWKPLKSDDKIDFTSKYGRAVSEKFFYTLLINFRSQFTNGYNYPNDSIPISRFMAPGYLTLSAGIDYKPAEGLSFYISPLTGKMTFVLDDSLSLQGAYGVKKDEKLRSEFGGFLKASVNRTVMENVVLQSSIDLFSNYLDKPGNIDINWQVLLGMKINKYLTASLSTQLLYDDNIKIAKTEEGITTTHPRIQFKEAIALGISYKF
jgi:hypothetical protein